MNLSQIHLYKDNILDYADKIKELEETDDPVTAEDIYKDIMDLRAPMTNTEINEEEIELFPNTYDPDFASDEHDIYNMKIMGALTYQELVEEDLIEDRDIESDPLGFFKDAIYQLDQRAEELAENFR